ncbi:MAG: M23 family metallopeptidase [Gemmatimonadales bacterium]|nr:M23 family metallopeptidase [Gemmatimonadales bacterium]
MRAIGYGVITLIAATPAVALAQQVGRTPLEVSIPASPAAMSALGRTHFVYEVHLTNLGVHPLRIDELDVIDQRQVVVEAVAGVRLAQRTTLVGQTPMRVNAGPTIGVGRRGVVFLFVSLPPGTAAPEQLHHRFIVSAGDDQRADTLITAPVVVVGAGESIAPPVRGGPWVAVRGPSATSGHRLSLVTLNGVARVPQRFAVDWAQLGDDGRLFHGDSTEVESWYSYGEGVYAVAGARVALVRDAMPDNPPFAAPPAEIDATVATGNIVVLELPDGRFASYAHLKPGSIRVKVGETVRAGQLMARIGNSGNTHAPHLHFQVGDGAELLASEGLPYTIRQFELIGRVGALAPLLGGGAWKPNAAQPSRMVIAESPLENMVVRFN